MRYHLTTVRMTTIKKTRKKCWGGCGEQGALLRCWRGCKLVQPPWRAVWRFLKKLRIELPNDLAILLPGMYPEEMKSGSPRDVCIPIFTAALCAITKS